MRPFDAYRFPEGHISLSGKVRISRPHSGLMWSPCPPSPCERRYRLRREVEGQVLIAQEHQPSPPELYVRLVTAYSSHGISYVFLIRMGCMLDLTDSSRRSLRDESSDGMCYRQEFVSGSTFVG